MNKQTPILLAKVKIFCLIQKLPKKVQQNGALFEDHINNKSMEENSGNILEKNQELNSSKS